MQTSYQQHIARLQDVYTQALEHSDASGVAIYAGALKYRFCDDMTYPFRANPNFLHWVPLDHHPECWIVFTPGRKPTLIYFQPVDYWHLPPEDPSGFWTDSFDIRVIRDTSEVRSQLGMTATLAFLGEETQYAEELGFRTINPTALVDFIHYHRGNKSDYEIHCMREASRLGALGHRAAESAFRKGGSEFDIHLAYMEASSHNNDDLPYSNIIALNHHSAVLHYHGLDRQAPDQSLTFLIDAGCAYHSYASDITRTYCADDSKIGQEFSEMIRSMDAAQLRLVDQVRAGADYRSLHHQAHLEVGRMLGEFELVDLTSEECVEENVTSTFYPHGLGHLIGIQVHDVGGFMASQDGGEISKPDGHPYLRLTRELQPGHVLTIEPGLYFIDVLLNELRRKPAGQYVNWEKIERFKPYGGIRIEDDVLVTADGAPENMTRDAFAALDSANA